MTNEVLHRDGATDIASRVCDIGSAWDAVVLFFNCNYYSMLLLAKLFKKYLSPNKQYYLFQYIFCSVVTIRSNIVR